MGPSHSKDQEIQRQQNEEIMKKNQQKEFEEQRKKAEEEKLRRAEEESVTLMQQRGKLEREKQQDEFRHKEEMLRIENSNKGEERKDNLEEKRMEHEQTQMMDSQQKIFDIISGLTSKVQLTDLKEVAYAATILHSIQPGKPVDKGVLESVSSKVANPSLTEASLHEIVDNVIRKCEMEENNEEHFENNSALVATNQ